MIDTSVSLLGFADSFNLLLWIVLVLGKMQSVKNRLLGILVAGDWVGICLAAWLVKVLIEQFAWVPPNPSQSPLLGIALCLLAIVAFVTRKNGKSLWGLASKLVDRCTSSPVRGLGMGMALGVVQSITSVPFVGGVLSLLSQGNGSTLVTSMLAYSMIAISTSVLILLFLIMSKQTYTVSAVGIESMNTLLAVGLFIIGLILVFTAQGLAA